MNPAHMDEELGKAAIDMFMFLSEGAKTLDITFTGGEPLLNLPLIRKLSHYAKIKAEKAGAEIGFVLKTNGIILDHQIMDFLKSLNFKVVISVDGLPQTHDIYRKDRNGEATQKKVVSNLKDLIAKGASYVASITVHPNCASALLTNVLYLHESGIKQIDIGPVYGTAEWTEETISELVTSILNIAAYTWKVNKNKSILEIGPLYKNSEHVGGGLSDSWGCGAGFTNLAFLPNGQITGCSALAYLAPNFPWLILGHLNNGLDDSALKHFLVHSLDNIENRPRCAGCKTAPNCTGGCLAINLSTTESALLPPSIYCRMISTIPTAWNVAWGGRFEEAKNEVPPVFWTGR